MRDGRRITRFLLAGMVVFFGLSLWGAGRANANCPASDPNCMGGGMSDPTSPPYTNPPRTSPPVTSNKKSTTDGGSHSTSPPVQRTTPATARRTPATQPSRTVQQPVTQAPVEDFVPASADPTVIQPGPAIALSGTAPQAGAGTAAAAGRPPAPPAQSGAGNVLWGFAIGIGVVGIGVGAATTLTSGAGLSAAGGTLEPVR
jgi:hypothetical protein